MRIHSIKTLIGLTLVAILATSALAVEGVRVMALFPGKAMVEVDGTNRLLKVGKKSPEGLLLISSDSHEAVIEINGQRQNYQVGAQFGGSFTTGKKREVRIIRDNHGSYSTVGSINGRSVNLLLDTGASSVAMSSLEAKRLGIQYWLTGEKTVVSTASGYANAYKVTLNRVQVGAIGLNKVEAMVVEGSSPHDVLLGMSFLNQVEMENNGNVMLLRSKY